MQLKYYRVNRVYCRCCGDVLEHTHYTKDIQSHRMMTCTCGKVSLDPSVTMYRILGNVEDYEDLSEPWEEEIVEARRMALASAMIQTYPETFEKETETLFLNIFWTRLHAECPEATSEEIEWARKRLHHLREPGVLERIDRIADVTFAELSALEQDEQ